MSNELTVARPAAPPAGAGPMARPLSRRQKAAVVVRLLLAEGAEVPLADLPAALQTELAQQMSQMHYVDRATLRLVIEEFASELDQIGLSFPSGIEDVLKLMGESISTDIAEKLRRQAGMVWTEDPWDTIGQMPADRLLPLLEGESPETAAIILSKLPVEKAAELMGRLPGDRARRLVLAVNETASVAPGTVRQIGLSLAAVMKADPPRAFLDAADARVGAILDVTEAQRRQEVLSGLEESDSDFAARVRRAIFTFADIPDRVAPKDVPALIRNVDRDRLLQVIAGADDDSRASVDFLLEAMSQRMAAALRADAADLGGIDPAVAEAARRAVTEAMRAQMEDGG
jgi:flagellar motor switch protein FliG